MSVETTSTSPLTIQYVINPAAVWSDGVPVTADDFIYAWQSQRGDGVDVDGQPDQVASTLGYRDIASVTSSHNGKTVTVVFATPFTDWRVLFHDMVPAHIARRVGWNHGFNRFNPCCRALSRPIPAPIRVIGRQRHPGPESQMVGNSGGDRSGDRRRCCRARRRGSGRLAASNQTVAQPTDFDLGSLDAVSSLPNTQSFIKSSLNLMQLEFNVSSPVTDKVAVRQAIAHAIDRTALLNRTFGSIDPNLVVNQDHLATAFQPATALPRRPASTASPTWPPPTAC